MGKSNLAVNQLLERKEIFADFINGTIFQGKHILDAAKLESEAFLSGITKEDRLKPVITTILYLGKEWDGSTSLYDMLDVDEKSKHMDLLKEYLPQYRINVIEAENIEHPEKFESCLQHIFAMVKYNKDKEKLYQYIKEHRSEIEQMDSVETLAAFIMMGEQKRIEKLLQENGEKEEIRVCQAIDELIQDGEERGLQQGIQQGEDKVFSLLDALVKDKRQDMIEKVITDRMLREKLYRKYHIL